MREIALTKGRVVRVDDTDFDWLSQWKWHLCNGYASRMSKGGCLHRRRFYMHQQIMQPPDGMEVDHIDFDRLNCQRHNMRLCYRRGNMAYKRKRKGLYTSRFKGVCKCASNRKWQATIKRADKQKYLGHFANEVDAALAYDKAARNLFGEFACVNFPEEGERGALLLMAAPGEKTLEKEPS